MKRRIAIVTAGLLAGWLVVLYVLGFALGSRQERITKQRLAESLHGSVTVADSDLALIRGRWQLGQLALRRDDMIGKLSLDVASVRCELGPLGWALVSRDCGELAVRGVRLEVSSTALFKQKRPRSKPIRAERVVLHDASLSILSTAVAPGLGRIDIAIEYAESGPTVLRTPLSWLLTLEQLRAKIAMAAGITVHVTYDRGVLTASGSLFGSAPVALPIELPVAQTAKDAAEEMHQLVELGKDLAQRLVAKRAQDWLESKLKR